MRENLRGSQEANDDGCELHFDFTGCYLVKECGGLKPMW